MSETLKEALQYAALDPLWLASPRFQQRYIKVLAAEVISLTAQLEQQQIELEQLRKPSEET